MRHSSLLAMFGLSLLVSALRPPLVLGKCDPVDVHASAVAAARRAVEAACACDGFPSHSRYARCAKRAVRDEVHAGRLERECGALVERIHRQSTCSFGRPKVACCEEGRARDRCRILPTGRCAGGGRTQRTACGAVSFCADTRCGAAAIGAGLPGCVPEVLYSPEGNRLRRFDLDTIGRPPLVEDVLIEAAGGDPAGRDINGQVCLVPDGSGRFVAGEDTGQPSPPPGWGVFAPDGTQVGKLAATYFAGGAEPFGCAFDGSGRLFTSEVGSQASGPFNGQLIVWFPPWDRFPGPPGAYPATDERSTNFCKIATDIGTAGSVAVDGQGRVYVTSARGFAVLRFSPPFPTSPDAAGGCGLTDALGSPLATTVTREVFVTGAGTFTGIARAPGGHWFISSVLTGAIGEYDANGVFLRSVVAPAPGENTLPLPVGHPQGLARDCRGDLYYADLDLRASEDGIGPGPNGKVRRVAFDACGVPAAPVVVKEGLAFPDGLGVLPGDLEGQ
jgi:hypothetical protein